MLPKEVQSYCHRYHIHTHTHTHLIYLVNFNKSFSFWIKRLCWYRLRMNMETLKQHSRKRDPLMFVGQLKWQLSFKLVCHGLCASKLTLLILLLVLLISTTKHFCFYYSVLYTQLDIVDLYMLIWPQKKMQINTCNGMRCGETFGGPNSPNKPSLWTENWTSLYAVIRIITLIACFI